MKQWLNSGRSKMRSNIRVREAPHMVKNSRASRIYQTGRGIPGSSRQGRGILRIYKTGRGILGYTRQGRTRAYSTSRKVLVGNVTTRQQVLSIAQDLLYCTCGGQVKTPKHVLLPLTMQHLTTNTELLTLINNCSAACYCNTCSKSTSELSAKRGWQ